MSCTRVTSGYLPEEGLSEYVQRLPLTAEMREHQQETTGEKVAQLRQQ